MNPSNTIAAIATPVGTGGISIVKISGPESIAVVEALFRARNRARALADAPSQTMVYGHILHPAETRVIDEVLVTVMKGPHSYTGEDVVEINCHGGLQVSNAILELLLDVGVRLAEPGEFTRRAFLNGRMDLTQVEGTIELINAKTRRAAQLGSQMLIWGVGARIRRFRDKVFEMRAALEAAIDFCDEEDTDMTPNVIREQVRREILPELRETAAAYHESRAIRHGLRVVLAGRPNVGKSSLMNRLLRRERVIVTSVPGTTRDTVEEEIEIAGVPILLSDTAGLHASEDPVERIGQQKAREAIENADLVLMLIDGSRSTGPADRELLTLIGGRPHIVVRNKIDLVPDRASISGGGLGQAEILADVSALRGEGIEALERMMLQTSGIGEGATEIGCLPNLRQSRLLKRAMDALSSVIATDSQVPLELIAIDLKDAERYFNEALGVDVEADVLDAIFNRFCIGK